MKKCTIIVVAWLFLGSIHAQQKIEKHIDFSGKESVSINLQIADSINLHTWDNNEISVTGSVNINDNKDNDAYITSFVESENLVSINGSFKEDYFKGRNNSCCETDIYWEIYIPEKTDFTIETINANITIDGKTTAMKVKSISGFIDLAISQERQADIDFSTITGTIYSNLDLHPDERKSSIPTVIKEKLNNGGSPIRLETISGDIFFRKSN